MPVQFETVATKTEPSIVTLTIPKPAGLVIGNWMLAIVAPRVSGQSDVTAPAGWTKITEFVPSAGGFNIPETSLFRKIADASDVAATDFTFTRTGAIDFAMVGAILRISGIDPATPLNVFAFSEIAGASTIVTPDVLTTVNGALLIRAHVSTSNTSGAHTATPPSGYTERVEISERQAGAGTQETALSVHTKDVNQPLAGQTGTESISVAGMGANTHLTGLTVAIAPALSGGGGGMGGPIQLPGERIERGQKILNPFGTKKRHCMCPIGNCTCV